MPEASRSRTRYTTKFGIGAILVVGAIVVAALNVYTNLAPRLDGSLQADLLSGIVTIVIVLLIGVLFLAASVGREAMSALQIVAARARQLEEGDFDTRLETNRDDEFGEIYRALAAFRDGTEGRTEVIDEAVERERELENAAGEWSAQMDAVASGDLSQRLDENVDDPNLAAIAESFNKMMEKLQDRQ
ncbi:HAMP domain-containing protein [Halorientalis regularis]|uniref:histidine kinase n=1 Tax=Halorientalis regularis TaxID=660518 RepID=A0A1G7TG39_9EURY|nr:HAMP domain-containing protein [Halorientalis regularis]SDG33629.1 methyl-accepting chemotaxis protein [Halorientalis regularis]